LVCIWESAQLCVCKWHQVLWFILKNTCFQFVYQGSLRWWHGICLTITKYLSSNYHICIKDLFYITIIRSLWLNWDKPIPTWMPVMNQNIHPSPLLHSTLGWLLDGVSKGRGNGCLHLPSLGDMPGFRRHTYLVPGIGLGWHAMNSFWRSKSTNWKEEIGDQCWRMLWIYNKSIRDLRLLWVQNSLVDRWLVVFLYYFCC